MINNPWNMYPGHQAGYQQQYGQVGQNYQPAGMSYGQPQAQQPRGGIEWVDGEVGAKAYQLPAGWPANTPMPLWDTNDTIIYLKSVNQMGMPNPIQRVKYTMEEQRQTASRAALPGGESVTVEPQPMPDMSGYVRRDELERMKDELKEAILTAQTDAKGAKGNGKPAV